MPDPKEEQRRSAEFDPAREGSAVKAANQAASSKRLKEPGKMAKNATGRKPPGKPRSGSDSNASRRTRGN
jgi:hypothetical protein